MRGWIWLIALAALAGVCIEYADAIKCLVCSSDESLKSLGDKNKNNSLYTSNCISPSSQWREKSDNPFAWDCEEYDERMDQIVKTWQTEVGRRQADPPPKGAEGCASYSICRSMYYEADLEYERLSSGKKNYKMVGDKRHVFRFCGCLYSADLNKSQDALIAEEFGGKATKCKDTPEGKVQKRRCHCNPKHKSFNGKPCNSAYEIRPHSIFTMIFIVTSWNLVTNHLFLRTDHKSIPV
jgi:hypothetical protein